MTGPDAPYAVHEIPNFTLACGATLRPARVACQTYGP
jgi:homoserine O-acetyltransferase